MDKKNNVISRIELPSLGLQNPEQVSNKTKQELESLMPRLLELLREILASIHQERMYLENDAIASLKELLERRQKLLEAFEDCNQKFADFVPKSHKETLSFLQGLERIQELLLPEDVELLLLIEQLTCITKEMMGETNSLIHLLEFKSATSHPHGLILKKAVVQPSKLAIGLADDDQNVDL